MKKIIAVEEKLVIRYVGITSAQNQYIDHQKYYIDAELLNVSIRRICLFTL